MGGSDLVGGDRHDQHEMPQIRVGQQILEQIERRGVEPLQVVEKERQDARPGDTPMNRRKISWKRLRASWKADQEQAAGVR